MNKWQFDENSFGNVPKPQPTTHNFQLYKDFFWGRLSGLGMVLMSECLFGFVYICHDYFVSEITQKRDRNQYSTVCSVEELVHVWNILVKILSGYASPNDNRV